MVHFKNYHFKTSPLSATLAVEDADAEGWREFSLTLSWGSNPQQGVASCTGHLHMDDYQLLISNLTAIATGVTQSIDYVPVEPVFMLRAKKLPEDEIEMLWVIDEGMIRNNYATQTGIGILITMHTTQLSQAIKEMVVDETIP